MMQVDVTNKEHLDYIAHWSNAEAKNGHMTTHQVLEVEDPSVPDANLTTSHDLAAIVDDTDGVARATPVQSGMISHMLISSNWRSSTRAGRSGGSLTDWRSGRQALAHHPVVRCGLPAPAVQRVSCGPSNGERTWSSRQMLRLLNTTPLRGFASNSREVHQ